MVDEAVGAADASIMEDDIRIHEDAKLKGNGVRTVIRRPRAPPDDTTLAVPIADPSLAVPASDTSLAVPVADPSLAVPAGEQHRVGPRAILGEIFTIGEARNLLPPSRRFGLVIHTEHAWLCKDPLRSTPGAKSRTKTWGGADGLSHRNALMHVLRWAWERWTEEGHAGPEFDLADA